MTDSGSLQLLQTLNRINYNLYSPTAMVNLSDIIALLTRGLNLCLLAFLYRKKKKKEKEKAHHIPKKNHLLDPNVHIFYLQPISV